MHSFKIFQCGFVMLVLAAFTQVGARGAVVFDNLNTPVGFFNSGAYQVGDEIVLAGGAGTITSFAFEFFGSNFLGGEQAQIIFYANDSLSLSAGYPKPGSVLWDSGVFSVPDTFNAFLQTNALVTFDLTGEPGGGVSVPGDFTWSMIFTGIGAGSAAGTILSSAAPTTGLDYNDYWLNTGTLATPNWQLQTNATYNIDFLAQVTVVPEPSAFSLMGVFGLIGLMGLVFRRLRVRA